jgi:hypothetical protein
LRFICMDKYLIIKLILYLLLELNDQFVHHQDMDNHDLIETND